MINMLVSMIVSTGTYVRGDVVVSREITYSSSRWTGWAGTVSLGVVHIDLVL